MLTGERTLCETAVVFVPCDHNLPGTY